MDVTSPNYVHGTYYKASKPDELRNFLRAMPLAYEDYTFVDFGSGKGLALLVASFFPFRRVVGVEFAADLNRIARANIAAFQAAGRQCLQVESVHADAAEWSIPEEPLICYFYEPFEAPVLARVLENLKSSFQRIPRPVLIVYHQAGPASVLYEGSLKNQRLILETDVFRLAEWQSEPYCLYAAGVEVRTPMTAAHRGESA
jgi:hypothetical protein